VAAKTEADVILFVRGINYLSEAVIRSNVNLRACQLPYANSSVAKINDYKMI